MQILARAAASLSDPGAAPGAVERLLEQVPAEAGLKCDLSLSDGALEVIVAGTPGARAEAFVAVLAECVTLAGAASARAAYSLLDARSFASGAGSGDRRRALARSRRVAGGVRRRRRRPRPRRGRERDGRARRGAGALGRALQRHRGHLGAGRFALLLPRAGSFEARSAYRRVKTAVAASEYAAAGVACGHAGFSELNESGSDLLGVAVQRLTDAHRRTAYEGPWDPSHPLAG